jgi:hypothetical protein
MSAVGTIATIQVIAKGVQAGWKSLCKVVVFKRLMLARAELEANNGQGADLDHDQVIGGIGNTPRTREQLRRGGLDRSADAQRQILDVDRIAN